MQDITEADALAYSDHCRTAAKLGARGHNKRVEVCRVVFNLAGILPNPFAKVRNWTENQQHRDALELPDLQRIMAAAAGEYRLLIAVGIFTGLRLGDAVNLQWQDIHDNRIWKATQKTGKPVSLALAPALAAELAKVERPTDGRGYVLPELAALYGRDPTAVSKRIRQLFEGVGIEVTEKMAGRAKAISRRGFHSLRTSFVTYCARAGIPTEAIAQWAGHSPEVDRLYQRHSGKDTDARFLGVLQGVAMVTLPASIQTPAIDVEGVEIEDVETLRIKLFRRLESADRETLTRILAIL
jgi:integrase